MQELTREGVLAWKIWDMRMLVQAGTDGDGIESLFAQAGGVANSERPSFRTSVQRLDGCLKADVAGYIKGFAIVRQVRYVLPGCNVAK